MKALRTTRQTAPPWEPELEFGRAAPEPEVDYGSHEWYPTAEVAEQEKEYLLTVTLPPALPMLDGSKPHRITGELTRGLLTVHIPKRR
jgi:HSP20 family molecular chaperone IbpA